MVATLSIGTNRLQRAALVAWPRAPYEPLFASFAMLGASAPLRAGFFNEITSRIIACAPCVVVEGVTLTVLQGPCQGDTTLEQARGAAGSGAMIQNHHDKVFKGIFSKPEHAADLLRTALPAALLEHLDMGSLRLEPGSFVDDNMRERFTDLLYRVTLAGREAFVYLLLEHKSVADALTAFFMSRYVIDILSEHVKNHPRARLLPAVIPLVVHHGAGGWNAAIRLKELYDLPSVKEAPALREAVAVHLLDMELVVDDISQQSDDELRRRSMGALTTLVLALLKKSLAGPVLARELAQLADLFAGVVRAESGVAMMGLVMQYIMSAADVSAQDLGEILRRELEPAIHEAYMSTADMIRKEGIDQGIDLGIEQGSRRMLLLQLEDRFGPLSGAVEERIRAAGLEQLEVWIRAVLRASTLDEILATRQ